MIISAEQLARIALEVFQLHESSPYDFSNPAVLWQLIRQRYPSIEGVSRPPSSEDTRRRYVLDFWNSYVSPAVDVNPQPTIGVESEESIAYNAHLRRTGITPEMMDPRRALLAELDLLASNPMAALSFVTSTAMGRNRRDALRIARAVGGIWEIVSSGTPAPVSDTTGQITHEGGPSVVRGADRLPDPYSAAEIRSRLARGYHGG